ncbi:hypothetical protein QJS10_CPA07g00800 [Acorus calamus]|uniref:U-box domain-containing protein n=1 Tax=Acorus calamus TaxID=4465 RepID=A0AAV9EF47_ACOCL|nr:hypothetical protein QJS10_CPA07g00800 [Acorus calamus]
MKHHHHHPKLKPLFSCGMFRQCTQTVLSPTSSSPPPPPPLSAPSLPPSAPSPPPSAPPHPPPLPSSSSSSSSTSQSFTQWRFPLQHPPSSLPPQNPSSDLFQSADLHFRSGAPGPALRLLDRSLVPDGDPSAACPPAVMASVVAALRDHSTARAAARVLLALLLAEGNRRPAVEAGALAAALEAVAAGDAAAERALAAIELMCTTAEGAAELRGNDLAVPALVEAVGKMAGRGRESAIGALAVVYCGGGGGGGDDAAVAAVARAVVLAMQGECSARGRRKGGQLLKALRENGRLDFADDFGI